MRPFGMRDGSGFDVPCPSDGTGKTPAVILNKGEIRRKKTRLATGKSSYPLYKNNCIVQAISIAIAPTAALQRPDRYGSLMIDVGTGAAAIGGREVVVVGVAIER